MPEPTDRIAADAARRPGRCPATAVSLSRVGVTGVEKVIRVAERRRRAEKLFYAELECFVDLNPQQAGVHMSRFEEIVGEAIDEVVLGEAFRPRCWPPTSPSTCASARAGCGPRSRSPPATRRPSPRPSPARDAGDLHPLRHRGRLRARHPHADRRPGPGDDRLPLRPGDGRRARRASGSPSRASTEDEIERIVEAVPIATHNQRGIGTLHVGCPEGSDLDRRPRPAADRRELDELGDLRADEAPRRAWRSSRRPTPTPLRRGLRAGDGPQVVEGYPDLRDGAFVIARQENLETIHRHNVVAERYGMLARDPRRARQRRALAPPRDDARVARGALPPAS